MRKYLAILLIAISGAAKGVMDTLQFHYSVSIFPVGSQFWDAAISWKNKLHTTLPVMFTDGWHLMQSIFIESVFIVIIFYKSIITYKGNINLFTRIADFLVLRSVFGFAFVLFYNYLLIKK